MIRPMAGGIGTEPWHALSRPTSGGGGTGLQLSGWRRLIIVPVIVVEFVLALGAAIEPRLAFTLIIAGAIAVVAIIKPIPILVLTFPAAFLYWRVGPAVIDMSITDAITILGTLAALPHVPWRNPRLRLVLLLFAFYSAIVAVSVLASPSPTAAAELAHRVLMVAGPLLIGSALANLGGARLALRAFVFTGAFLSVAAVVDSVASGLAPAYPFGMHKNAVGSHFASALLILLAASPRLDLSRRVRTIMTILLFLGLLASQSRGAAMALVAAAAIYLLRSGNKRLARLAPIVLGLALVLITFAILSVSSSLEDQSSASQFNSVNSRLDGYRYAIDSAWRPHIPLGSGPKWFRLQGFDSGPHNMVVSELSETGVLGTAALAVFLGGALVVLWRMRTQLADAAVLVLIERLLDAMLGILWVAGTGTVPWLVAGLALGEEPPARDPPDGADEHGTEDGESIEEISGTGAPVRW